MNRQIELAEPLGLEQINEQIQQQMDRAVALAEQKGVTEELLWSVFEIRLMRALKGEKK